MGINKFLIILIIFVVGFLIVEKEKVEQQTDTTEQPKVTFYDSTMYEITEKDVNQIVKSKQVNIYDTKEELFSATIVSKSTKSSKDTSIVSGNKIIKTGDKIYLEGSVNLQLHDGTNIKTEQLYYNTKTKIANNSVDFIAVRDTNTFNGNTLYLDILNENINAKKTKFRMKVQND